MRRMRHLKPREIQGCQLALDASIPTSLYDATSGGSLVAADGAVARWEDQSGNARHVTQSTSGSRPARRVANINGIDALEFDGTADELTRSSQILTDYSASGSNVSIISAFVQDGTQANHTLFSIQSSVFSRIMIHATFSDVLYFDAANVSTGRMSVAQPSGWDNAPHVLTCVRAGAGGYINSDNALLASKSDFSGVVSGTGDLRVGNSNTSGSNVFHKGRIGSLCVWNLGLPDYVAKRARNSQQRKWRING